MKRKYTTSKKRGQRKLLIKRHNKEFQVVEGRNELFKSTNFDSCVAFLDKERQRPTHTDWLKEFNKMVAAS